MRRENLTIALLSIIAVALVAIAVEPIFAPRPAEAQSGNPIRFTLSPVLRCYGRRTARPRSTAR